MSEGATVISGPEQVRIASMLALRSALKLETKGLKRHGRSARVIANEYMGTKHRTSVATYNAFNTWLVETYGVVDRPL
jgi:hypothetical protein